MIIPCHRCGNKIDTPGEHNADYILAGDLIVPELRETPIAYVHTNASKEKIAEGIIDDPDPTPSKIISLTDLSLCKRFEVKDPAEANILFGADLVCVMLEPLEQDIQKSAVICPACYLETDFVIWGVHKTKG